MVNAILFDRSINNYNTTVSMKQDSDRWTHSIELCDQHLQLLRDWLERNRDTWQYNGVSLGETFLMVVYARRDA